MLQTETTHDLVSDYRYALDVMEEHSNLGLDDEFASKLRDILLRHISDTESALSCCPATPVRFPFHREKVSA